MNESFNESQYECFLEMISDQMSYIVYSNVLFPKLVYSEIMNKRMVDYKL